MPKTLYDEGCTVSLSDSTIKIMKTPLDKEDVLKSNDGKDQAAVSMGRRGGVARAAAMTPERRVEIAKAAALKRWSSRDE